MFRERLQKIRYGDIGAEVVLLLGWIRSGDSGHPRDLSLGDDLANCARDSSADCLPTEFFFNVRCRSPNSRESVKRNPHRQGRSMPQLSYTEALVNLRAVMAKLA
jgi:hypothetical protein